MTYPGDLVLEDWELVEARMDPLFHYADRPYPAPIGTVFVAVCGIRSKRMSHHMNGEGCPRCFPKKG